MRALPSNLRKQLETSVLAARRAAESASRAALTSLGVFTDRRPEHLDAAQAALRNGLRAKWRQLDQKRELLAAECAYEQWHRLLFARFLAENQLLLHPEFRAPVSLADCDELAAELGEPDGWSVAARFAAGILPGIFRLDDPCVRLRLAPEGRHALEQILDGLPLEVFAADDALGWVYQFWQKDKKDEVNASERKIGGADLGPVTQLFTENYMVRFLLENSLGAWWAARRPGSPLVEGFDFLRFDDDGRPSAGSFDGWPDRVADVTVMDPCCGSGHFLVEAFSMLWQMRAEDEGLEPVEAQDAVLRDNLFGLELDPRCVQIAMFAVALQAWKAGGGWRQLPVPNVACSGIPVKAQVEEWKALAGGDARLQNALARLHILFRDADTLGSLIDPKRATEISNPAGLQTSLEDIAWEFAAPRLETLLQKESHDPAAAVLGARAAGIACAADLLVRRYTLTVTNVPYLGMNSQLATLAEFLNQYFNRSKADLATAFAERWVKASSALAVVLPQNWMYIKSYRSFRDDLIRGSSIGLLARLGPGAFSSISGEVVQPVLVILDASPIAGGLSGTLTDLDTRSADTISGKTSQLRDGPLRRTPQDRFLKVPDLRIVPEMRLDLPFLEEFADSYWGIGTGDGERFQRRFWEVLDDHRIWNRLHQTFGDTQAFAGRTGVIRWHQGRGPIHRESQQLGNRPTRGDKAWGHAGIAINQTGNLEATLYTGEIFQAGVAAIIPKAADLQPAIWAFCSSGTYRQLVRSIDPKLGVMNATLLKVPFDVDYWRKVAEESGPLPEPFSDDPTQWLFEGMPGVSTAPLQVAVARLVGYRWPEQEEPDDLDSLADMDGIVCLPSVAGEAPAADRVQEVLASAFGESWSPATIRELLERTGSKKKTLADWLRDEFFKQHCALFGNRPFVWHIWDGQRDGFSALVDYHRLDRKTLEKLTYTYLGQDWVERQRAATREEVPGAEARLAAALELQRKLEAILAGEKPYDIFVRWKESHEQSIGWEPDLNDGVRLNIRPFVEADVLRAKVNVHWKKDRGKNPDGSERRNDIHMTLTERREARRRVGRA
jgi:hypothetical protein